VYKSLKNLPTKPDIGLTVIPPVGTDQAVGDAIALSIKEVWMPPGSMLETVAKKAKNAGIKITDRGCFVVVRGVW
jgi:predicted CoA-binding protein